VGDSDKTATASPLLLAFTLLGSYCITANAAIALHELGHGLGMVAGGGKLLGFYLAPQGYSGSYAARDFSVPFETSYGLLLQRAGGPVFGAAFGLIPFVAGFLFKRGSVGWIVMYGTATWSIGNNGAYLFLGSLHPFDDALDMIELGVPRAVLFLAGLPLVIIFLMMFATFLGGIGLKWRDAFWRCVFVVEAGLLGYLGLVVGLRFLWPTHGQMAPTASDLLGLTCSPVAVFVIAACTYFLQRARDKSVISIEEPRWAKAGILFAIGLLFIAVEFLFFSYDYELFSTFG
jgi:hypothetical protein